MRVDQPPGTTRRATSTVTSSAVLVTLLIVVACQATGPRRETEARLVAKSIAVQDEDPHAALYVNERFPSAKACRTCHPDHYRQWSVSPHAYAQHSPVFNAMAGRINQLTNGTLGDFCIRCHTPVGMALEEPVFTSNLNRHPTSLEGVTCIACHRVNESRGKVSGRRSLVQGALLDPIYGPTGNAELQRVIDDPEYSVVTDEGRRGRKIHGDAKKFFQLVEPGFCGSCHDVLLPTGFRLEEAFSEYKTSPAAARGESCQDCHMGREHGVASGYHEGPAAIVGGKPTRNRKITNHMFIGPDYSIVHPGIFPHNPEAQELATISEWLEFDWRAGWGTDAFEDGVDDSTRFPERWSEVDDRYEAREILEGQFALLEEASEARHALLRRGYLLGEIKIDEAGPAGLGFSLDVTNGTDGHNVPTGFIAERLVFVRVTVRDPAGKAVFRSGDLDPNGDVRDLHSIYVHNGEVPLDEQLFSLQSKFLTRTNRGGERERILAVNRSLDPLPFIRPPTNSAVLAGRPGDSRIHRKGIHPGHSKTARYEVEPSALTAKGTYTIEAELVAAMVPVNLVHAIQDVGFDYGLSPREVADRIVEGHLILWQRRAAVEIR